MNKTIELNFDRNNTKLSRCHEIPVNEHYNKILVKKSTN